MAETSPFAGAGYRVTRLSAAEVTDEIWLEVGRREASSVPHQPITPAAPPHRREVLIAHNLPSLLNLDGADFINAAYMTILGRKPDEAGSAHLLAELAQGTAKVELLGRLQASPEARQTGRSLPGLGQRYLARRLYRVPVVGPGARLTAAVLRRTGVSRNLLGRNKPAPVTDLTRAMTQNHGDLLDAVDGLAAQIVALQDRLNAQQAAIDGAARRGPALQSILDATARRIDLVSSQSEASAGRIGALNEQVAAVASQLPTLQQAIQSELADHREQLADHGEQLAGRREQEATAQRLTELEHSLADATLALADTVNQHAAQLAKLDTSTLATHVDAAAGSLRHDLGERILQAEQAVARNTAEVFDQQRRLGLILEAVRRMDGGKPTMPPDHTLDPLYVTFEDRFRGTKADIKQRQRVYLPVLAESQAGQPDRPVVDIGCGRGEFLDLLRDEGLTGRGVDSNEAMAAACRATGLDVAAGDALEALAALPEGSLGAVTGFHIIEHLPFPTLVRMLDAAFRALAPGGVIVFETPNPANVLTASRWFWLDPTHRHPLPGEMMALIAEARGYTRISILELHPTGQRFEGADPVLLRQLDALFHGPQDYALIARKP